jgi:hypothetical protein
MDRADALARQNHDAPRMPTPEEPTTDCYQGVELAPCTLESLVTWDVSGHAQRERDRLNATHRIAPVRGGY